MRCVLWVANETAKAAILCAGGCLLLTMGVVGEFRRWRAEL